MAEGFRVATAYVSVSPDLEDFREKLQAELDEATEGAEAKVKVGLDTTDFDAKIDEAKARLDELDGMHAEPTLGLDDDEFRTKADDAGAKFADMDDAHAEPALGLDKDDFDAKADEAQARLDELEEPREATLGMDKADFDAEADEAEARLDELEVPREASLGLNVTGGGAGGEGGLSSLLPGGMMGLLAGGLTAAVPGIAGAATGLGLLAGTGALAVGGVMKALEAHSQAAQAVGETSAQLAATEFANAVAVQQAEQAIAQAKMAAAQQAKQSSEQIIQADQAVGQAEEAQQQAVFGLSQAQYNLSQAWISARYALEQLKDQEQDSATSIAAARLAVQQAVYQQQLTDQNAMSTSLDREQAAIAVTQAQENLTSVQQQATYTQQEYNLQEKAGVAGSQQVVQAKEAVQTALYGVGQAEQQVADAQRNAALVAETAAYQQEQSAIAIATAQRNLTDTIREQQLQQAATTSEANQAANQYAKDFAMLTPAGQGFVNQLLSMHGALKLLESTAQGALLPGLTLFLGGIKADMPIIARGISQMGSAMSAAFGQFGRLMQTSAFRQGLEGLFTEAVRFTQIALPPFAQFLQYLGEIGSKKGAVDGVANLVGGLGNGLLALAKGIEPFAGAANSLLTGVGRALAPIGAALGTLVGILSTALGPALNVLVPPAMQLVAALGSALTPVAQALAPILVIVARAVASLVRAVSPLLPPLGTLIAAVGAALTPALAALLPPLNRLFTVLAASLQPVIAALQPDLVVLAQTLGKTLTPQWTVLLESLIPLIPVLAKLTVGILAAVLPMLKVASTVTTIVMPALTILDRFIEDTLVSGISWLVNRLFWLSGMIGRVFSGIQSLTSQFIADIGATWAQLEGIFSKPVKFLVDTVYDKGIAKLWNDVVGAVGLGSIKLPIMSFARGGIVPGQDHGYDSQLVVARPGEGFLTNNTVAGLGGPPAVDALNKHFASGSSGAGNMISKDVGKELRRNVIKHGAERPGLKLLGFAGGGTVPGGHSGGGGIGGFFSGLFHDITSGIGKAIDIGKIVTALATGNTTALVNNLDALIGHGPASGDLAKLMTAIPKTLVTDAAKQLASLFGGGGPGGGISSPGNVTGTVASWFAAGVKAAGVPVSWIPGLETIAHYESGDNANAINLTDCLTLDYVILTKRGWLRHDQVQPGDETIGYNPATERSEWTRITRVVHYDDAEVWRIGNSRWHADVTPNHRWWSDTVTTGKPQYRKERGEFVQTDSFKSGHRLRLAAVADTDGIPCLSLDEARIIAWLQGDGTISPVLAKPDICPECGWVPGDYRGRVGAQLSNAVGVHRAKIHGMTKAKTTGALAGWDGTIWQSKPVQVVKLRALLASVPHTETSRGNRGKTHHLESRVFRLRREYVTDLIKRSGLMETGPEAFVLALSPDQRAAWLGSMIDAEGHSLKPKPQDGDHRPFVRIAQVDGPLQDAIKLAVYLEGYRPTYSASSAERRGYTPAGVVGMARPHVAPSMFSPHQVLERQPVWCVTTELGTWTTEGGDVLPFLTGNSNAAAGDPSRGILDHAGDHDHVPGVSRAGDQHEHLQPDREHRVCGAVHQGPLRQPGQHPGADLAGARWRVPGLRLGRVADARRPEPDRQARGGADPG